MKWEILIGMLAILLVPGVLAATAEWVDDPADCPSTDATEFPGQDCSPNEICGESSDIAQCYDTDTLNPPSSEEISNAGDTYQSGFDGGFIIDCFASADAAEPYCDNSAGFWCNRNNTCYSTRKRKTNCTKDVWAESSCEVCRTGFLNCTDDIATQGKSCEVQIDTTNCAAGANNNINGSCNCVCDSSYYYCDGDLEDADGCEVNDGGSCTAGSLSGTYSCSASAGGCYSQPGGTQYTCTCIVDKSYFETGTFTEYSTNSIQSLLWGKDHGTSSSPLLNLSNATDQEFLIDTNSCIIFWDGTTQCSAPVGGVNMWVDNGTYLTPDTTYANSVNLSEAGAFLDALMIYIAGVNILSIIDNGTFYKLAEGMSYTNITDEPWIEDAQEGNLNTNASNYWDNLDNPPAQWGQDVFINETGDSNSAPSIFLFPNSEWNMSNLTTSLLRVKDDTIDTTVPYFGFMNQHQKTAGVTDGGDNFSAFWNYLNLNQVGGVIGRVWQIYNDFTLTKGETLGIYGIYNLIDLRDGKATGDVQSFYTSVDQSATNEVTGNIYGINIKLDADGTVGGTVYGLYLDEGDNIDYGIYQDGTADNYFGGNVGIGTPEPNATLHVVGNANITGRLDVLAPATTPREVLFHGQVSDAPEDRFAISQATSASGAFGPLILGSIESVSTNFPLGFIGQCDDSTDTGTTALVGVVGRKYLDGEDWNNPASGFKAIENRPIFVVRNKGTVLLQVEPDGEVYIGGGTDTNLRIDGSATGNPYLYFLQDGSPGAYLQYIDAGAGTDYLQYDAPKHYLSDGDVHIEDLEGSYTNGESSVCVWNNGTIFARDGGCN